MCITECLDLFGKAENIKSDLILSLVLRKAKAAYDFSERKDKINHLLFIDDLKLYSQSEKGLDSLVQAVCIFSKNVGMEFGIEKSAMLVMKKGKIVKSVLV